MAQFHSKLKADGRGKKGMSPLIESWIKEYVLLGSAIPQSLQETAVEHTGEKLPAVVLAATMEALSVLPAATVASLLRDLVAAARGAHDSYNTGIAKKAVARARRTPKRRGEAGKKD